LIQLPVAFSAGSTAKSDPVPGLYADDVRLELVVRVGIDADRRNLTWTHMGQARFAEIRLDPDAPARQQREYGVPGSTKLPTWRSSTLATVPSSGAVTVA
jgi:hypothetical protein